MNENEKDENVKEYEAPEVFELGQADELTHGGIQGDWYDGIMDRRIWAP